MTANLLDDASLPTDRKGLEAELAELEKRLLSNREKVKNLVASEDPLKGIFHAAAIHEAKQEGMMLRYQKELREVRLNRATD